MQHVEEQIEIVQEDPSSGRMKEQSRKKAVVAIVWTLILAAGTFLVLFLASKMTLGLCSPI